MRGGGLAVEPKGRNFQRLAASRRAVGVKKRARPFDAETLQARAREVDVFAGNRIPGCRNFLFSVLTEIRDWKVTNEKKNHPSDNFFV